MIKSEKDNRIMTGNCNQDKIEKISAQGQNRIARTGYLGQENRTGEQDSTSLTGRSAKTLREIIIGFTKT